MKREHSYYCVYCGVGYFLVTQRPWWKFWAKPTICIKALAVPPRHSGELGDPEE